jgi:hypothetical protein
MQGNRQLSDIFTTLSILANSLMQGHPLPAYLPKLRDRLVYHEFHSGRRSNPSLIKSMFSRPITSDVKGVEKGQGTSELDPTSQVTRGGNTPTAGPETVDGSSIGIELDELTLDVLLVSLRIAHRRLSSVDFFVS